MMKCSQAARHAVENTRQNIFMNCSLFNGKQICLWCCLHLVDLAAPTTRVYSEENHPEYGTVTRQLERDWDSIWETCSKCVNR